MRMQKNTFGTGLLGNACVNSNYFEFLSRARLYYIFARHNSSTYDFHTHSYPTSRS